MQIVLPASPCNRVRVCVRVWCERMNVEVSGVV
jgi:hypothetical protein